MEVRRTVRVKLRVPDGEESVLRETVERFRSCSNRASEWAWNDDGSCVVSKAKAKQTLYADLKSETDLHANLVQKGIDRAINAVKSGVEHRKKGRDTSRPYFTALSAVYDKRSATFHRDRVSLSTLDGRIECEYVLPLDEETPHHCYLLNKEYEFRTSTLHCRDGTWYLHAVMQSYKSAPEPQAGHSTVLGVDIGVKNIAVSSTGVFWTAGEFNHWRCEYERRRCSLQQTGTRWAHRNIESVGRKQTERFDMLLHRISNELVAEARDNGCSIIVFEKLTGIRDRLTDATWQHLWAFRRLYEYVEYKALADGIVVEQVDPKDTSQRCSTCGFTHPNNRDEKAFECQRCGYENHADYNAAKNIGIRYLRRSQTGADGGAPVGVRLNSGTLNASGEYSPPHEDGAGVHAENPRR